MDSLTVSQLNNYIKEVLDAQPALSAISVRGEASNYRVYPSGHHYFTLKDADSVLKCVMFRGDSSGLKFKPADGMKLVASGRVGVFPRDGQYQLYCKNLAPDGVGSLAIAFEQLKAKLEAEGLFDPRRKKKLPAFPETIGLITSPAGAAVRDMLRILGARWPLADVKILPVRVQGDEAPPEIIGAIEYANRHKLADVLIVGRGGGSIEDLWAFNDENVARAIAASEIPIVSAVGHEPDVTIADYAADLRAATPSNAAELAVPDQNDWRIRLDTAQSRMATHVNRIIANARRLTSSERLTRAAFTLLELRKRSLAGAAGKLDALSPLKVLSRGYAVVGAKSVTDFSVGGDINLRMSDGHILAEVKEIRHEKA
ncbi:hypothetical protein FACS1894202_02980 [Clostridia bacterium]|nr:hypothetical protein FACS1894202_02980 [Clostridia bacterium]